MAVSSTDAAAFKPSAAQIGLSAPHAARLVQKADCHHSGSMVKPVQRPKMTTRAQQASEIPPASLAGRGGVDSTSHFCTPRTVMSSKISMLIPARTMMDILIQNVVFTKYPAAWLMNRSEPAIAASTKAAQVHGRNALASSVKERLAEVSPSRRRSTIAIVPITSEIAKT